MTTPLDDEERQRQYAMELASGSVLPLVLRGALEMGVLEIIVRAGPGALLSPPEIASSLHSNNPHAPLMLDRILRLLASHSILTCSLVTRHDQVTRLYGLARLQLLHSQSRWSFLGTHVPGYSGSGYGPHVDPVMEGGLPFNRACGMNSFNYVGMDERCRKLFTTFMGDHNILFIKRILETYRGFEGLASIVDVGGGDGSILNMIVSKYPALKATNFDLPTVIEKSPPYPGIEHVAGDMFMNIPKGDAIFMKWILHSWDDEQCMKVLRNCYESLPDNGKVIVVDMVVPETPEDSAAVKSALQLELFLMNMNPGGKERTKAEFQILAKEAGFSNISVAASAYNFSLVEFYKNVLTP